MWIDSGRDSIGDETRMHLEAGGVAKYRAAGSDRIACLTILHPGRFDALEFHGQDADQLWDYINSFVWRPNGNEEQAQ